MNPSIAMMIFGMAAVTYLPRVLPSVVMDKITLSAKVEKFLQMIPYTAMAALIFPGVLTVDTEHYEIGMLGALTAGILAWKKVPVIFCVVAAIAVDVGLYLMMG